MSRQSNRNLKAFNEVLEEYEKLKYKSKLIAQNMAEEHTGGTPNLARPSASDFVCDVEKAITSVAKDDAMIRKVVNTFLMGKEELDKEQQNYYEQSIGWTFIKRSIWPTAMYFRTVRNGHAKV
jgi:hypothetical protein